MEPISMAVGGALLIVGWMLGRVSRKVKSAQSFLPDSICSCKHGYGQHQDGNKCVGEIQRASRWDSWGTPIKWEWVQCTCVKYDGPEPLPSINDWPTIINKPGSVDPDKP